MGKAMTKTDYDKGRTDGYCQIPARYPHNVNYMTGHAQGEKRAENEWRDSQPDDDYALRTPSHNTSAHSAY